jgi:hypothetical protein
MGNDLIWKIAVGVFLGMAAWTHRADLGTMALYAVGFFIVAFVGVWCYQSLAEPIKATLKERKINQLVSELLKHNLIDVHHDGALRLGLISAIFDEDYMNLVANLNNYRRDLRNGEEGNYFKNQIHKIVVEVVENFKQSTRHTASIN